jgi:hypothetical protein
MYQKRLLLLTTLLTVSLLLAGVWFGRTLRSNVSSMPYTQLISHLEASKVTKVTITDNTAEARLNNDPTIYIVDLPDEWQDNAWLSNNLAAPGQQRTTTEVNRPFFRW